MGDFIGAINMSRAMLVHDGLFPLFGVLSSCLEIPSDS